MATTKLKRDEDFDMVNEVIDDILLDPTDRAKVETGLKVIRGFIAGCKSDIGVYRHHLAKSKHSDTFKQIASICRPI